MADETEGGRAYIRQQLDIRMVGGRYSSGLVTELMSCVENNSANIFSILREIELLEGTPSAKQTRTKKAAPFTGPLLSGLRHKHYSEAVFIARNLEIHWGLDKPDKEPRKLINRITTIMANPTIPDEEKVEALAEMFVNDGYRERGEAQGITGEWIVYAQHEGVNHYLTLGTHMEGDDAIHARVLACYGEFPYLEFYKGMRQPSPEG